MSVKSKAIYTPVSLATSVLGGILAGLVFKEVWRRVGDDQSVPDANDLSRSVWAVLAAAVIQGAVFGLVKAAVERAGARGYQSVMHESPA